ncbi:type II toxin-antitoxin system HicB family antitoxin [Candidatus Poribacteria bacterium]|nr:type II toxin-antitoxin system HicB family antitoxin [Candidatus Poribacteria bacterium]MXV83280.1 type II toxin-antitoxin system HicB family antitoxin [Candidatus Poribacteria bacterium]
MKTYSFQVVLEKDKWPDEPDENAVWRAYIPALEHKGAASWGYTQREALKNLQDTVELLVEYLLEQGEEINLDSLLQHEKKDSSESCSHIQALLVR